MLRVCAAWRLRCQIFTQVTGKTSQCLARSICSSEPSSRADSNEQRARAYLKKHGLGSHASDDVTVLPTRSVHSTLGFLEGARNIPEVAGIIPSSFQLANFLEVEGGALDVVDLDVSMKATFTNNLIVCTGRSPAHLKDLANRVTRKLRRCSVTVDGDPVTVSLAQSDDWLVVDAGVTVVHLLLEDTRNTYAIEELWGPESEPRETPE